MIYFATYLLPSYQAMIDMGGTQASGLLEQGNPIYYNGLAVVGFAVASLLFFNALFMAVRSLKRSMAPSCAAAWPCSAARWPTGPWPSFWWVSSARPCT